MPFTSDSVPPPDTATEHDASHSRRLVLLPDHAAPRVSVVIPARNEARNLPHVLRALPEGLFEVILVDGCSTDDTIAVAEREYPGLRVLTQNRKGKGNALAVGFAAVRGDIVVMLDADGSADPTEIPRFVQALVDGADFAKGTRFAGDGGSSDLTVLRTAGNRGLNGLVNTLFGTRYTDLCYGYNAFWTRCLTTLQLDAGTTVEDVKLWGDGFEIETIINCRIARARLDVVEVPSFELERLYGESNLNTWRDGFRVLRAALTERTRPGTRRRLPGAVRAVAPYPLEDPLENPLENPAEATA